MKVGEKKYWWTLGEEGGGGGYMELSVGEGWENWSWSGFFGVCIIKGTLKQLDPNLWRVCVCVHVSVFTFSLLVCHTDSRSVTDRWWYFSTTSGTGSVPPVVLVVRWKLHTDRLSVCSFQRRPKGRLLGKRGPLSWEVADLHKTFSLKIEIFTSHSLPNQLVSCPHVFVLATNNYR